MLKLNVLPPDRAAFPAQGLPSLSPDGGRLAFLAVVNGKWGLWIRDLDVLDARLMPGTEGATHPFWSPDSRFLAFFAAGKLKKIEVAGGSGY